MVYLKQCTVYFNDFMCKCDSSVFSVCILFNYFIKHGKGYVKHT